MVFNVTRIAELPKDRGKIKRWPRIELWEIPTFKMWAGSEKPTKVTRKIVTEEVPGKPGRKLRD